MTENFDWITYIDNYEDVQKLGIHDKNGVIDHYKNNGDRTDKPLYNFNKGDKILVIISAHTRSVIYFYALLNNIIMIRDNNKNLQIDIVVINSDEHEGMYNYDVLKKYDVSIYYTKNDKFMDFGKWMYGLDKVNHRDYSNIVFTNDSIIVTNSINDYFEAVVNTNVDFFGFTNNNEIKLHYQSYLFSLKSNCIGVFRGFFNNHMNDINKVDDVINIYEVGLYDIFENKKCFIDEIDNELNIFFYNDFEYIGLLYKGRLPIIKMKRLLMDFSVSEKCGEQYKNEFIIEKSDNILKSTNYLRSAIITMFNNISIKNVPKWYECL